MSGLGLEILKGGRRSGVLMHPTSLPGSNIGGASRRFIDWLADAGQSCWQILPLVDSGEGGSPYNGLTAVAGNPLLVDVADLADDGLLGEGEVDGDPLGRMVLAQERLSRSEAYALRGECEAYRSRNAAWLDDYALFKALRDRLGGPWTRWPVELRGRAPGALARAAEELRREIDQIVFQQYLFDRQWAATRRRANERGIAIIGDIPIFVAHDSADVWLHQDIFLLDQDGKPSVVAGVPPDYFSATGQRWGNPLFRWDVLKERGYGWWVERFRRVLGWVDIVRVDHFRGFQAYWEIPASEPTAVNGRWVRGPGADFFRSVQSQLGELPIIAEDLGLITPEVHALREELGYPGMRVIQFAFDGDPGNPHLPANYPVNTVAYTGTHDNDTTVGWWSSLSPDQRHRIRGYFPSQELPVNEAFLRLVWESRAKLAVAPLQDVLGLGPEARMNTPGTVTGNWEWTLDELPGNAAAAWLREVTEGARRAPGAARSPP